MSPQPNQPEKVGDLLPGDVKPTSAPDLAAGTPHPTEPPCALCGAEWHISAGGRWVIEHIAAKHSRSPEPSGPVTLAPETRDPLED